MKFQSYLCEPQWVEGRDRDVDLRLGLKLGLKDTSYCLYSHEKTKTEYQTDLIT